MALFNLPTRNVNTKELLKKTKTAKKTEPQIKLGKDSLLTVITNIKTLVETKLGKYKDKYKLIDNEEELEKYIDNCIKEGVIAIDTETTGLNPLEDEIL